MTSHENMAHTVRVGMDGGELMRYAEYSPKTRVNGDANIDKQLGKTLITAGLGVAALAFAGRFLFQRWKVLEPVFSVSFKKLSTSAYPGYYKGGFENTMSKREAGLILGISPTSSKSKISEAHRRIMMFNHTDNGGSLYIAKKINEARDLLVKENR
ncbi:dnaJ homolog subfamily C member 15-like [Gouania willdenowi]|uniref:DnaJ homolog subfamily C member 15-like n=1 Tax=Gouania willdenowi TaxID=441366 RepID=A0A8C5HJA4_GOUWI|nr:dnaJ homolog subfamily C member 15-like [Gouania willdenowi]